MTAHVIHGQCINQRRDSAIGFDAFAAAAGASCFALCDGANSCPDSGRAAEWLSQQLVAMPVTQTERSFATLAHDLHEEMQTRFPETASTAVWLHAHAHGVQLGSVGDSSLKIYSRAWLGWGPWREVDAMPRDIDENGHPSQLLGSEVLYKAHCRRLPARGALVALMMSDGPANVLLDESVLLVLNTLGRHKPSCQDLDYLCRSLVNQALDLGCQDDASVAMIWLDWS